MAALKRLVFNADDFGLTDGICSGVALAIASGVVKSTTAMACTPGGKERLAQWGQKLRGHIGIHLQLTTGKPCLDPASVRSLVNERGEFPQFASQVKAVDVSEVKREWEAQFRRLSEWNITPTHMDSHHHVGTKPDIVAAYVETAGLHGIPARTSPTSTSLLRARGVPCADLCITEWYDVDLTPRGLLRLIEAAFSSLQGRGTIEVMCHPGYADSELAAMSKYVKQREHELKVLTSTKLMKGLQRMDIDLISASSLELSPQVS
jgi:chitin disaccharide deacetylase